MQETFSYNLQNPLLIQGHHHMSIRRESLTGTGKGLHPGSRIILLYEAVLPQKHHG